MGKVLVTDTHLTNIANAIRSKNGTSNTYKPSEMASAIENIETGGTGGGGTGEKYAPRRISFEGCTATELDYEVANLDTRNVTSFKEMFRDCVNVANLSVNHFKTNNVTDFSYTFYKTAITTLDISNWNFENATKIIALLSGCTNLTTVNLGEFKNEIATSCADMFYNNAKLTSVDLSEFVGTNVTSCSNMFYNDAAITSIDLRSFNPTKLTNINYMLYKCSKLKHLDVRSLDISNLTNSSSFNVNVPSNCEIIVKDDTQKTWWTGKNFTNVKTVAELEA